MNSFSNLNLHTPEKYLCAVRVRVCVFVCSNRHWACERNGAETLYFERRPMLCSGMTLHSVCNDDDEFLLHK